jgi:hypothetical protein
MIGGLWFDRGKKVTADEWLGQYSSSMPTHTRALVKPIRRVGGPNLHGNLATRRFKVAQVREDPESILGIRNRERLEQYRRSVIRSIKKRKEHG